MDDESVRKDLIEKIDKKYQIKIDIIRTEIDIKVIDYCSRLIHLLIVDHDKTPLVHFYGQIMDYFRPPTWREELYNRFGFIGIALLILYFIINVFFY